MRKIKVAHVITRMDWGGAPDVVRILCERLNRERYDTRLIYGLTLYPSKKTEKFLRVFRERISYVPNLKRDIDIFCDILAFINLYKIFLREKFDIVHTHTAKAGALGRIAAHLAGVKVIVHSPHGHNFYGYFNRIISMVLVMLEYVLAIVTDRITVLTQLEKEDLIKFKVTSSRKICVIRSGVELENYRPKLEQKKDGQIIIGMVGRLEPVKGPEYFIRAARVVVERFPDVRFFIVGDGTLRNRLKLECKKLGISASVEFKGWMEDIPEILPMMDILVLPSLNEAVGRVLIEAAACGVPVVASNVGGVPEIVRDGETGILVQPRNIDSIATAIITLIEDREKRLKMGSDSKAWVTDRFGADAMVENFSRLYEKLLGIRAKVEN